MMGRLPRRPVGPDVWVTCRELIPAGSVFAFLAEHRDALFPEAMFADMYPSSDGRPSVPPGELACAVVLQTLHGLSDVETVQHLRCDLRWKAACGLGLNDGAFDPSLLAYFRRRLARSRQPDRVFDAVREVVAATGVLKGRHRRALDSAVLEDAVATQDTVTQLIAAIRRVIRDVPSAGAVATGYCRAHDYTDPGKPRIAWNDEEARNRLVDALVTDALNLLGRLPEQDLGPKAADAVGILALVAGQDVEPADDSDGADGRWRIARRTVHDRVVSTVDPDARHVHKTLSRYQDGFKAHLAVEPETGLITAVTLRPAAGAAHHEAAVAPDLLNEETAPLDVLADSAYSTAALRAELTTARHRLLIKPAVLKRAVVGGFTLDDFRIDAAAGTVTCPAGHTTALLPSGGKHHQRKAWFTAKQCTNCPLRARCTRAKGGRVVTWRPHHDLQESARRQAADPAWQADYRRWRPAVERTIAWLVNRGNRRLPCRGTIKGERWIHHRAAALNLRRLINLGLTHHNGTWTLAPTSP
ncbi:IS1182 family transposase [Streptomyces roseoverticillatus]|uniref:IS1182 family transposase n=1 Tax=Streptomyces roseoverticillatus TaxID=66429 RepID=UPI001F199149|nr:IS1182 family transposase [Streptomyces roseoverticillatus]MCF3103249.1 IS1182 family transposase [Streptomyces roseoverticillatus]